jgi:N-acetylglucosaminyl-diphospho-decaprenol L-rhamnosyltransferase
VREEAGLVAVVVVTYNSAALLPDLIRSLPAGLGDLTWHLIIVDNASADETVRVAAQLRPDATIVQTGRNAGYAAAINAGVAAAPPHAYVLVLNPDVRLAPGCVPALRTALRAPGTGISVPLLTDGDGTRIDSLRREPSLLRILADALLGARRAGRLGRLGEVISDPNVYREEAVPDWAEGSTLLISAECLRHTGPWDESYFLYSEETEFALRARDRGFRIRYTPAAQAVHIGGDSRWSPALWALLVTNRVRLHRRRKGWLQGVTFWGLVLTREVSRSLLGKATSRAAVRALLSPRRMRETPGPHVLQPRRRPGSRRNGPTSLAAAPASGTVGVPARTIDDAQCDSRREETP